MPTNREAQGEVERIVAGLTDAQRRKIIAIGNGQPIEFALGQAGLFLIERGYVFVNELGARHLTDTGHAVRQALQTQEPDHG